MTNENFWEVREMAIIGKTAHAITRPGECVFCYKVTMGVVRYRNTRALHYCCTRCWESVSEAYGAHGLRLWELVQ